MRRDDVSAASSRSSSGAIPATRWSSPRASAASAPPRSCTPRPRRSRPPTAPDRAERHAHPQPLPDGRVGHERRAPHVPDVHAGLLQPRRTATTRSTPRSSSCSSRRSRAASPRETVEHTKRILAIVIAFGGQWPHSTYMMPGGVTCPLDADAAGGVHRRRSTPTPMVRARRPRLHAATSGWRSRPPMTSRAGWRTRTATARSACSPGSAGRSAPASSGRDAAPAELRLLLRPRALAAAVRRAAVPAARGLLRRRARARSSRSRTCGGRAPAPRQVRRPRRGRHPWDSQTGAETAARRGATATPRRPATRTRWSSSVRSRTWSWPATR